MKTLSAGLVALLASSCASLFEPEHPIEASRIEGLVDDSTELSDELIDRDQASAAPWLTAGEARAAKRTNEQLRDVVGAAKREVVR